MVVPVRGDIGAGVEVELFDEVLVRGLFNHQFDGIFKVALHASILDVLVDETHAGDDEGPALAGGVLLDEFNLHVSGPVCRLPVVADVLVEPIGVILMAFAEDGQISFLHLVLQEIVLEVLRHLEVQVFEVDGASGDVEGLEVHVSLEVQPVELAHALDVGGVHDVVVAGVELPGLLEGADAGEVGDAFATDVNLLDGEGLLEGDEVVPVGIGDGDHRIEQGIILESDDVRAGDDDALLDDIELYRLQAPRGVPDEGGRRPLRLRHVAARFDGKAGLPVLTGDGFEFLNPATVGFGDNLVEGQVGVEGYVELLALAADGCGRAGPVGAKVVGVKGDVGTEGLLALEGDAAPSGLGLGLRLDAEDAVVVVKDDFDGAARQRGGDTEVTLESLGDFEGDVEGIPAVEGAVDGRLDVDFEVVRGDLRSGGFVGFGLLLLLAGGVEAHRGGEEKSRENVVEDAFHDSMFFNCFLFWSYFFSEIESLMSVLFACGQNFFF